MRGIKKATCSCGGTVREVEQTDDEKRTHNCKRGCCGTAIACDKCGVRIAIRFESPDF